MKPFIVGITGSSGIGKSEIAKYLARKYKTYFIDVDNYYKDKDELPFEGKIRNWELPSCFRLDKLFEDLNKLKKGKNAKTPLIYWRFGKLMTRRNRVVKPKKIIFVEGLYLFYNKKVRDLFDLKIFLTAPYKVIEKRRISRGRGKDDDLVYVKKIVLPYYKKFGEPTKKYADYVIDVGKNLKEVKKEVNEIIEKKWQ